MAHEVESMFYAGREVPWHGLGTQVDEAPTSADALRLAGLDWEVEQHNVMTADTGIVIPNCKANVRSSDGKVLGVVSDRYTIVQNHEAFSFTDNLIGGEVRYETAGSLKEGRKIWLLAKMPDTEIVGDKVEPYLCFSNTHDGSGAIRVCMTPIRVVCNNTLNVALNGAQRSWSSRHVGNIDDKLHEAQRTLELAGQYMSELAKRADELANVKVTDDQIREILDEMFPIKETDTDRTKRNHLAVKTDYMVCLFAPDIAKFRNTAWGAVNAMSDYVSHRTPIRNTKNYKENNWDRIMDGHAMMDQFCNLLAGSIAK